MSAERYAGHPIASDRPDRGVYRPLVCGTLGPMVLVNHRGEAIHWMECPVEAPPLEVAEAAWSLLDLLDPQGGGR